MATAEADAAVVTALDAISSPYALTSGINLFLGPPIEPDAGRPSDAVFVTSTGGPLNGRFCGTSSDLRMTTIQVVTRADRANFTAGQAMARACRDALHCAPPTGYVDCLVREPDPYYLKTDAAGRHFWALNAVLVRTT